MENKEKVIETKEITPEENGSILLRLSKPYIGSVK